MNTVPTRYFFAVSRIWLLLLICAGSVQAQFVTKSNRQFMYQGSSITFYGSSFDPAAEGFASAWHKSSFTNTINADITHAMAAGQNILRPTDYWDSSTPGQTYNDPVLWSNMDFLVAGCKNNGMFVLMDISAWKQVLDQEGLNDMDTNNWLSFIDYVSARYRTNTAIAYWSIAGEPSVPTNLSSAASLVAFYSTLTSYLYNDDSNHLICAGAFIHMEENTNLNWWQDIYALPHNDVDGYKTYSQNDLNLAPTIGSVAAAGNKILVDEEFGMPQYMGDGVWSGSNYNSIVTSVSTFYTNVYNAGLSAGAAGFVFWNLDDNQGGNNYDVWPSYMPVTWGTIQSYSPPPQPPLNLTATNAGPAQIDLNWTKNAEATVIGYNIYGNTTNGFTIAPGNRIASSVTTNYYSDTGLSSGTVYYYRVTALNQLGHESAPSVQTVPNAPLITMQPQSETLNVGQTAQFTVVVSGAQPLSYQWLAGATNGGIYTNLTDGGQFSGSATTNLLISNVTSNNTGNYLMVITNSFGSVTSSVATLIVIPPAPPNVNALAYEPFNYPTGDLTANNGGGTGWVDASWSDPTTLPWKSGTVLNRGSDPYVVNSGLTYSNLSTAGLAISNNPAAGSFTAIRAWNLNASGFMPLSAIPSGFRFCFPLGTANNLDIGPLVNTNQTDYTRRSGA